MAEPLRTALSDAVDEIIERYENAAWNLATERLDPKLLAKTRRAMRENLRSLAATNFMCLIAEIRQLRRGPYLKSDATLSVRHNGSEKEER